MLPKKSDPDIPIVVDSDVDLLDDSDYAYLIQSSTMSELILDDLTEEELEYLEQTFDIGEIL